MRTGKQEICENLKFGATENTGIATFLFLQTRDYKMRKKEKRTRRKGQIKKKIEF